MLVDVSISIRTEIYDRGIPVMITQLFTNLDVYLELLSTFTTLRLCRQFGQGDHAYIGKLPTEILSLIECELRISLTQDQWFWPKTYCCFEGSCCSYKREYQETHDEALDWPIMLRHYDEVDQEFGQEVLNRRTDKIQCQEGHKREHTDRATIWGHISTGKSKRFDLYNKVKCKVRL